MGLGPTRLRVWTDVADQSPPPPPHLPFSSIISAPFSGLYVLYLLQRDPEGMAWHNLNLSMLVWVVVASRGPRTLWPQFYPPKLIATHPYNRKIYSSIASAAEQLHSDLQAKKNGINSCSLCHRKLSAVTLTGHTSLMHTPVGYSLGIFIHRLDCPSLDKTGDCATLISSYFQFAQSVSDHGVPLILASMHSSDCQNNTEASTFYYGGGV